MTNNRIMTWRKKCLLFSLLFCNLSVAISQGQPSSVRVITCSCSSNCEGSAEHYHVAAAIYPEDADFITGADIYCKDTCAKRWVKSCNVTRNDTYTRKEAETKIRARTIACDCAPTEECRPKNEYFKNYFNTSVLFYATDKGGLCDLLCSDQEHHSVSCHVNYDEIFEGPTCSGVISKI